MDKRESAPLALQDSGLARVAIIGRPNVGKSTLFNRFVGRRKAIVDPTSGVTRDPISQQIELNGHNCILIDTGGLSESREYLDRLITDKSLSTIEDADILLFTVDIVGLTAEDEQFVELLRRFSDRIILVINKVDNERRLELIHEYHSLGFSSIFPVSAAHGHGMEALGTELAKRIATVEAQQVEHSLANPLAIEDDPSQTAPPNISAIILGQPNTGKSTLANLLSHNEDSIVSEVAGTTRDVLERQFVYEGQPFRLLDTAGIRRKKRIYENVEYYSVNRAIAAIEQADIVFLLIDAEKGLSDQDKKIASQVVKHGRAIILVMNKWDLMTDVPNSVQAMIDRVRFFFPVLSFAPVLPLSAKTGRGIKELLATSIRLRQKIYTRIDTGPLNRKLASWKEQTPTPSRKGFFWKVRYITQVSILPMKFILFVNKKKGFPESYLGFIRNRIREDFQLQEIPMQLEIRDSRQK